MMDDSTIIVLALIAFLFVFMVVMMWPHVRASSRTETDQGLGSPLPKLVVDPGWDMHSIAYNKSKVLNDG